MKPSLSSMFRQQAPLISKTITVVSFTLPHPRAPHNQVHVLKRAKFSDLMKEADYVEDLFNGDAPSR